MGEIARLLSRGDGDVRRMIEAAEELGYIAYEPTLTALSLDPEAAELARNESLTSALVEAMGERLESMHTPIAVTPSPRAMFTSFDHEAAKGTHEFNRYLEAEGASARVACARAAKELANSIFDGRDHVVGLNWGYHVSETIGHVRPRPSAIGQGRISVVSLFGDLDFHSAHPEAESEPVSRNVNCNSLVAQLAQRLGGAAEALPLNVPGFIPAPFARDAETFESIRTFLTSHATYQRIFGGPPPEDPGGPRAVSGISDRPTDAAIARMDTILTGFGAADRHTMFQNYQRVLLADDEIPTLLTYFREGKVAGDLGGYFIPSREGRSDEGVGEFLSGLNRRLLAAQLSDFVDVASRHRKDGTGGGVVGVTVGARKARVLYALLSMDPSPISRLVIDTHCALALLHLLDRDALTRYAQDAGQLLTAERDEWSPSTRRMIPLN